MSVSPDTQLGPYRIEQAIGAGGMGEVYSAQDTRLDRRVAVKVLPAHLSASLDLRKRLEREAKAISSLQHPNICSLFDIGHEGGLDYLVMEYLEGQTLAERLEQGPLSLEETLKIGTQIAAALGAAHQQGIIHRDLKPGNIMLTKAGVKLLDFGLAKSIEGESGPIVSSPGSGVSFGGLTGPGNGGDHTMKKEESALTAEGTILGTFQYMAPEQLEGVEADARTDIFALGAVLYEMATGRKAFHGGSQASLIAAIMSKPPESISSIQPMAPPALDHVIRTCLAKDREERWQTAADVARQLRWIEEGGSQAGVPRPVAARRRSRERLAWVVAAVLGLAAVGLAAFQFTRPGPPEPVVMRFQIEAPSGIISFGSPRISPDGRNIAFNGSEIDGSTRLWLRPINGIEAHPIPGTDGALRPFWSPDSRHLGFFSAGKLKRVPIAGGPAQTLCEFPAGADGVWGAGDKILFDGRAGDSIQVVSAGGGTPAGATWIDRAGESSGHGWPFFLPDGERFVFLDFVRNATNKIRIGRLGSRETEIIGEAESRVEFLPPGYLVYESDGTLLAHPFDTEAGRLTGDAFPLAEGIGTGGAGLAHFSGSSNGTLIFNQGGGQEHDLIWYDRGGKILETLGESGVYSNPMLSPDGRRVAVSLEDDSGQGDLWIIDLARSVPTRFTFAPEDDYAGIWSPDGRLIYFGSDRDRNSLWVKNAGGTGQAEKFIDLPGWSIPMDITRDGSTLLTWMRRGSTSWDIVAVPTSGDSTDVAVQVGSTFFESWARFSPDDRYFAYTSSESGRNEVFLSTFPAGGGKWQISDKGGIMPFWNGDGNEVYYLTNDRMLMAVDVTLGERVEIGLPRSLFRSGSRVDPFARNHYVNTPDGQRFLMVARDDAGKVPPTTVVLNWDAEFRDR